MSKRRGRKKSESKRLTRDVNIRLAVQEDLPDVLEIVHKMGGYYPIPISDAKVLRTVVGTMKEGFVLVAEVGGRIVGVLGLEARQWWFSDDWFLGDNFFMILPEHRGMEPFAALVKAAQSLSDKTEIPMMLSILNPERTMAKIRLFSQVMDGECWGANFVYGMNERE